jgi:energy-coupling factor transporter ATP-binding protein EcfA2
MSVKANDFGGGPESRTSIEPPSRSSRESTPRVERPFAGLRAFTFADRAFFFGRERQVSALRKLLQGHQFVALIGGSGCGKSSLVLAGLSSVLIEESADGSPGWVVLDMRPGNAPLQRLARTLSRLSMSDGPEEAQRAERIELRLRQSSFSFDSAVAEAGGLGGRSLLLVIDQFEELFRFGLAGLDVRSDAPEETQAREDAIQFVQILLDAAGRRLRDVHILITMRSDFIGDCSCRRP